MVGIFSMFSTTKTANRRTRSSLDGQNERELLPPNPEAVGADVQAAGVAHGIEVAFEFKPVEHPIEPPDNDRPVQCPVPEPSVLNDGRIWKERVSAEHVRRRPDLSLMKDSLAGDSEESRSQRAQSNRMMLPSVSAPEHHLVNLLNECNATEA
ncbi:hypothetical protein RND81_06G210800 [Saponaria officinalis]|uniref:Uncharacterized protein n=1 Tax=Saponaria officinalis TaxID=3572 RepID=A0AAW1K8X2_SAPOF